MTIDGQFLFDNQLIAAVENLIRNSKNELLLISPFIDLDKRIQDALYEKIEKPDFKLRVLFGKNENNIYKSIKNESLDFLKKFPNVEIRYNDRLHAKFFQNDTQFILTSLNLYNYSLANNIECGFLVNFASTGILGKVMDGADTLISQGVSSVKNNVFGIENNETDPLEKFNLIYEGSELKFKSEPILKVNKGISSLIGSKKLEGINIVKDELIQVEKSIKQKPTNSGTNSRVKAVEQEVHSASKISKLLDMKQPEFVSIMENEKLINGNQITELGIANGLVMKNYMGRDYIGYPENIVKRVKLV
ncbi:hypothetical protein HPE56_15995 [Maribacter sp. ANRC-HE7]|uniref:Phospholipase D-like domain-containing protein n=1 Tax=Maribacter aquimaris TaxID=2737171 RepID=A0ABR7V3B8_9FLAO|nr:phospholipase D-like domain-containing protein [Maribacter aquimaris]MBD0779303.1 hypothetical protein [Maribacter aquimaris]